MKNTFNSAKIMQENTALKQELIAMKKAERARLDEDIKKLTTVNVGISKTETMPTTNKIAKVVANVKKVKKVMHKARILNAKSLNSYLMDVVADGKPHTIKEFQSSLESSGWKSSSAKPYTVIASALAGLEKKNCIKRVVKGSYEINKTEENSNGAPVV